MDGFKISAWSSSSSSSSAVFPHRIFAGKRCQKQKRSNERLFGVVGAWQHLNLIKNKTGRRLMKRNVQFELELQTPRQRSVIIGAILLVCVLAAASGPHSPISGDDSERKRSCQLWFMSPSSPGANVQMSQAKLRQSRYVECVLFMIPWGLDR